jgi:predicted transcriptional regulator
MKTLNQDQTKPKILELAKELTKRRQNLKLSQLKLSKIANLSSSIINKFENGKIDPTLSTIYKIEQALESQEKLTNLTAKDIMIKEIAIVENNTIISKAAEIMRENDFSQLLVMEKGKLNGVIYETNLLDSIFKNQLDPHKVQVQEILSPNPIIVPPEYTVSELSYIFSNKKTKFVLVGKNFKYDGIITSSDIFKN